MICTTTLMSINIPKPTVAGQGMERSAAPPGQERFVALPPFAAPNTPRFTGSLDWLEMVGWKCERV